MRADEIHPGDLIAGKYRVRAILGRNHGLLVEAFHTEFDQRVVIKVLLAGSGDEREIERFRRESRVLAKLASEHAARIIDVGTEPDGSFYLVREYLDGTDLGTFVQQHGALPLVDAVLCVLQVAEAVAETHGHGIIVRELGPSHLFLTQRAGGAPLIKIGDFGTAKLMREAAAPGVGAELTATAMFGLSPYASPELLRKARSVDARTDVWSLGAIFYELLTGRPPFVGETTALMLAITREEPTPPSHLVPGLPPELDPILGWALAKDVDGRFKNVHAFAHALAPYASPEGQVLIDRIAQIDEVARGRRRGGSVPPAPPSFPSARAPGNPVTLPPPAARPQPITTEESVTDVRLPREAAVPGQHAARALPPPPAGQPMGMVPDLRSAPASAAPPAAVASPPLPSAATAGGRRAALLVIALSAVLVPVLLVQLLLKRSGPATGRTTPSATPAGAATTAEPAETAAAPAASAAPSATASAEPASSASAAASTEAAASASAAPTASAEASAKPSSRGSRAVAAAPAPPPPPPPSAGGATGTLLAVVVGGTCAFQVNGASKGSGASLKLALKPGTYAVVCRPSAGGAKSKSVTVRSGETAMAAFKL